MTLNQERVDAPKSLQPLELAHTARFSIGRQRAFRASACAASFAAYPVQWHFHNGLSADGLPMSRGVGRVGRAEAVRQPLAGLSVTPRPQTAS